MWRRKQKTKKGFTLIEFVVVIAALSLFLLSLVQITRGGIRTYYRGLYQTQLKQSLRRAAEKISTDLRQAVPEAGSSGFITPDWSPTDTAQHQELEFFRFKRDPNGVAGGEESKPLNNVKVHYQIIQTGTINYKGHTYTVGRLVRDINDGTPEIVADDVVINKDSTHMTYFKWAPDPEHPTSANNYVMQIKIMLMHQTATTGERVPLFLESAFDVALRADRNLASGSNYPPSSTYEYTSNTHQFYYLRPTSLIEP